MKKVYFRVDSSIHIGSGHVMRCLSFAEILRENGCEVFFAMRPQPGDFCDHVRKKGFNVQPLPEPVLSMRPKNTSDYAAWLQVSELEDAKDFLRVSQSADVVIIDHYGIGLDWENYVSAHTSPKIVVIDDLLREHSVNLIIDQTLNRKVSDYQKSSAEHILTGTKYCLLHKSFAQLHNLAKNKSRKSSQHKILLSMGGIDNLNATLKVLKALGKRTEKIPTTVLLSQKSPSFETVEFYCETNSNWINHIPFSNSIAQLMLEHTIAIGAPGSTSWERACLGLPSLIVPLAENQNEICRALVEENAALFLSIEQISDFLNTKLDELFTQFEPTRLINLNLCDGRGCDRVLKKLTKLGWI